METLKITESSLVNEENILTRYSFATTYFDSTLKIVGVVWHGTFKTEDYIQLFDKIFEDIQGKNPIGFYSDIRKQGVVPVEARKYFENVCSPKGTAMGMNKTGVVTDASPFKKYYLNTVIKMTKRPVKLTSNPVEALEFILS
ncbi:hypothetical protein JKA74_07405 [Marivirga sp. S37H4]|uniref:Uncharacterized protein n=1 Tax=Marivirga aurantiaca TaxID=2802615 RepID=A0A934WXC1_9BACT|nr:hypothetical protein [Marivirga aurantiaca]MBK6264858.1 hypothetical protein [Marivirga aurantiaca]